MDTLPIHLVRALHAVYVGLLIGAPLWIAGGALLRVRALVRFEVRAAHLGCMAFTALQFALGWPCPLTVLERALGGGAGPFVGADLPAVASASVAAAYLAASIAAHVIASRRSVERGPATRTHPA